MTNPIAIEVESLSKRYTLGASAGPSAGNVTLRDEVVEGAKGVGRRLRNLMGREGSGRTATEREFWALRDVSFRIEQGARVGVIGRNGAGKSTLLKLLSRITEPTNGRISIRGRVSSLLEVGTGFHPELTGRENIFLNGAILGMTRAEVLRKFHEIVEFAEVQQFIDTPVKRYSSGMYVRLAFAVAAHIEPEILIVDEVLAVGDVQFQKKCLGKMEDVSREGRTIIFVSHNFAAVRSLCNNAILMSSGRMMMQGGVDEVIGEYMAMLESASRSFKILHAPKADVLSIALCDRQGQPLVGPDTDTEIHFRMTYRVKEAGRVNMVLNLSREGNYVFQSINNHDPAYSLSKQPGVYTSTCVLPGGYLNNGTFTVGMTVFEENYLNPATFTDVLSFEVGDGSAIRGDYFGGLVGCTRPNLVWKTEGSREGLVG